MRKSFTSVIAIASLLSISGCNFEESETQKRVRQTELKADETRRQLTDQLEANAIQKRANMMNTPGLLMYVVVRGRMDTSLAYLTTGRIVSSGKRINAPDYLYCDNRVCNWRTAPNMDGTYGSSGDYVYFWTTSGAYWEVPRSDIVVSNRPIRLNTTNVHVDIAVEPVK